MPELLRFNPDQACFTPGVWANTIAAMRLCMTLLLVSSAALGQTSPAGNWISRLTFFDQPNYDHLQLELKEGRLTGKLGDEPFEGTFQNGRIEGNVKAIKDAYEEVKKQ